MKTYFCERGPISISAPPLDKTPTKCEHCAALFPAFLVLETGFGRICRTCEDKAVKAFPGNLP